MKKRIAALFMAFAVCCAPVSAFAEEVTPESLAEKTAEFEKTLSSLGMNMTMNLDGALELSSEDTPASTIALTMDGTFDVKEIKEPLQMSMTGTFDVSAMGTVQSLGMEMYMVTSEDGTLVDTYIKMTDSTGEGTWQHQQADYATFLETFGVSSMEELEDMSLEDILPEGIDLHLEAAETDSAYQISGVFPFSDLMPIIEESMSASGQATDEETMAMVDAMFSGFVMNVSYDLDKETYAVKSIHADFNDSDLTTLNELIATLMASSMDTTDSDASAPQIALQMNDFSVDGVYNYEPVTEITIPADALATEITDAASTVEDLAGSL